MKRYIFLSIVMIAVSISSLYGQKSAIFGDKAPSIQIKEYIIDSRNYNGKATYIEFFKIDSPHSIAQLEHLERFAKKYRDVLNFIVLCNDSREIVDSYFNSGIDATPYSVALDNEGRCFKQYRVDYVPTSILIDRKGDFVWQGRSSELTDITILNAID